MDQNLQIPESPRKRYSREYIGIVENVDDPRKLMRVQVRVKDVFTDDVPPADLPWAVYRLPVGAGVNDGSFTPVAVGDYVWVDFPFDGDTRRPRITGSVHFCPGEVPNLPHEAFDGPDALVHSRAGDEPDPAPAGYHRDRIVTQHGVTVETGADHSIRVTQRKTGTAVEITTDGHVVIHGERNIYFSAQQNQEILIMGNVETRVIGDQTEEAMGDRRISSRRTTVNGGESVNIRAPRINLN